MAYVSVPKDLTAVKTKVMFNLTKRQLICFGSGAALGVPLFFLLKNRVGSSTAAVCMIVVMLPCFLLGIYEKNGQPLEKILWNVLQVSFLRPKQRPYETNNFYDLLERQAELDKEVMGIVSGGKDQRGGSETDRRSRVPCEETGQKTQKRAGQHPVPKDVPGRDLPRH